MSKKKNDENPESQSEDQFDEIVNFDDESIDLDLSGDNDIVTQKIDTLADGTEILRDEENEEEEKEEISDKDLRKLIEFTTGVKANLITDEDLNRIRNDEDELERLIRISSVKARSFNYFPKKNFGTKYKKARAAKNRQARKSRSTNHAFAKKSQLAKRN